ncbi:MAG: ribosome maturation factor RimP [Burkholderiales bacterium]|nr:ribosome maturation factor RimP [Burkholderiales bacterium]
MSAGGGKPAGRRLPAPARAEPAHVRAPAASPFEGTGDWRAAVRATVEGLHYELVEVERALRGLLRVTIDRRPGHVYGAPGEAVTVEDCEAVTRQLQYALEVDGVDYARLEVSSPGLDRPLRSEADYQRFAGQAVSLTLKQPFQGRKHYQGPLGHGRAGWQITFEDGKTAQVLSFALDEVREARLVPVLDFKGRKGRTDPGSKSPGQQGPQAMAMPPSPAGEVESGGPATSTQENEEGRNR